MITEEQLNEIETRVEAATPGPWMLIDRDIDWWYVETPEGLLATCNPSGEAIIGIEDAAFVAHARTDIPRLIEEVRRLRTKVTALDEELSEASWRIDG